MDALPPTNHASPRRRSHAGALDRSMPERRTPGTRALGWVRAGAEARGGVMRVLHVVQGMGRGGPQAMIVEHVRRAGPGVEPLVCALDKGGPALEQAAAAGARAFVLAGARSRLPAPIDIAVRLLGVMRRERVTVVNAHDPRSAPLATLAAVWARVPVVVRTEHAVHYRGRHSPNYPALESLATRATRKVVCVCEAVRVSHAVRLPWAGDRFVTVLNGVSAPPAVRPRGATRAELGLLDTDRLVLAVGSLTAQKAHHVLVEAFQRIARRMSGARLAIAGDGPRRAELERQVADAGLSERVQLLGEREDVADLMEAADVFALASVREALSVTVLEAMRAGCPVVTTRIGGTPEAVVDGETGWVVPPNDPTATADALLNLLHDRVRARAFSAAGRDRWAHRFTAERMVAETERLYQAELAAVRDAAARRARAEAAAWSDAQERTP